MFKFKNIVFVISLLILLSVYILIKSQDKPIVEYTDKLTDNIFDKLVNNEIQILIIKNSYKYLDKFKNNILSLNKKFKKWEIDKKSKFDVDIIQTPLSNYYNNLTTLDDYLNQENIIDKILYKIENPLNIFKDNLTKYKTFIGYDPILNNSNKYQKFIIRKYNEYSINSQNGLIHIDTDDTGLYADYTLLSVNLYLNDFEGGELKYWKNFINYIEIKPNKGDMIIINPNYYHSVLKINKDNTRISIQSFILIKNNEIYIRN